MRRTAGFLIPIVAIDQVAHFLIANTSGTWALSTGNALIHPVWNRNGVFSWPIPLWILVGGSICMGILLFWMLWRLPERQHRFFQLSMFVLLYGAAANLFDRIVHGAILDYIDVPGVFPIFNIPDVLIFCGVIGILWDIWSTRRVDSAV